jgi:hypothetical protein
MVASIVGVGEIPTPAPSEAIYYEKLKTLRVRLCDVYKREWL